MLVFNNICSGGSSTDTLTDIQSDSILTGIAYSTNYEQSVLVDYDGNVLTKDF